MIRLIINKYHESSDNLLDAMREAINLIDIDSELYKIDYTIMRITKDLSSIHISGDARLFYNRKTELLQRRAVSVNKLNAFIINSVNSLLLMLKITIDNFCLDKEVSLCQKQLDSVISFINKSYVIKDIDISTLVNDIVLLLLKYSDKKDYLQYNNILNNLIELYNIANQSKADIKMTLEQTVK